MVKRRRIGSPKPEGVAREKRGREAKGRRPKQVVIRLWDTELAAIEKMRGALFPEEALASAARAVLLHAAAAVDRALAEFDRLLVVVNQEVEAAKAGKGRYELAKIEAVRGLTELAKAKRMAEAREMFASPAQLPGLAVGNALPMPPDQMIEEAVKVLTPGLWAGSKEESAEWTKGFGDDPAGHPVAVKVGFGEGEWTKGFGEDPAGHPVAVKGSGRAKRKAEAAAKKEK